MSHVAGNPGCFAGAIGAQASSVSEVTRGVWQETLAKGPQEAAEAIVREIRDKFPDNLIWARGVLERAQGTATYNPQTVLAIFEAVDQAT